MKNEQYISQKFGRLTILELEPGVKSRTIAICKCDCGKKHKTTLANIRSGKTKSCGCLLKESRTAEKRKMTAMLDNARAIREKRKNYLRYDEYDDFSESNVNFGWKI